MHACEVVVAGCQDHLDEACSVTVLNWHCEILVSAVVVVDLFLASLHEVRCALVLANLDLHLPHVGRDHAHLADVASSAHLDNKLLWEEPSSNPEFGEVRVGHVLRVEPLIERGSSNNFHFLLVCFLNFKFCLRRTTCQYH